MGAQINVFLLSCRTSICKLETEGVSKRKCTTPAHACRGWNMASSCWLPTWDIQHITHALPVRGIRTRGQDCFISTIIVQNVHVFVKNGNKYPRHVNFWIYLIRQVKFSSCRSSWGIMCALLFLLNAVKWTPWTCLESHEALNKCWGLYCP